MTSTLCFIIKAIKRREMFVRSFPRLQSPRDQINPVNGGGGGKGGGVGDRGSGKGYTEMSYITMFH